MSTLVGSGVGIGFGGKRWTPKRLGSALAAWYRSDMGVTIATGVSAWADQSGNGRLLLQGVSGAQPALVAGATPNGKPVLRFDGADDFMRTAGFGPVAQPYTVVLCAKYTKSAGADYLFDGGSNQYGTLYYFSTPDTVQMFAGAADGPTSAITDALHQVIDCKFHGASSTLGFNGGTLITGPSPGTLALAGFTIGAIADGTVNRSKLDVSEVVLVNRAMTAPERARLVAYMRAWSGV